MSDDFKFYQLTAEDQGRFFAVISGESGVGKTSFACNILAPAMLPALVIDIDRGLASVASLDGLPDVIAVQPEKAEALVKLPALLKLPKNDPDKPPQLKGIKTVILDSISAYQEETVMRLAQGPLSKTKSKFQAEQRDYLIAQNMILSFVDELRNMQNLNFIMLMALYEDKEGRTQSGVSPGLRGKLPYRFSMGWNIYVIHTDKGPVHLLQTQDNGEGQGLWLKTRNSRFRQRLLDESFARLKAAGRNAEKNRGVFILKDPMSSVHEDYKVDLNDMFLWYQEALSS